MGEPVVAVVEYWVRPEQDGDFLHIIREKWALQESQGYIEGGARLAHMEHGAPLYVEVFRWRDENAIARAHQDHKMLALWDRLDAATVAGRWEGIRILNGVWVL